MNASRISFLNVKTLSISVLAALIVYAGFGIFVMSAGTKALENIEAGLASYVIEIQRPVMEAEPVAAPAREYSVSEVLKNAPAEAPNVEEVFSVQKQPLLPAPYEGLTEKTQGGFVLPVVGTNNLTPFQAYKKPFTRNLTRPAIAVVLKDYGLSATLSKDALSQIPSSVSILISPYSYDPNALQVKARQDGHEVWLELPAENKNFPMEDPGPRGLLSNASLKYNLDNLEWVLSRAVGYSGVAVSSDGAFTQAQSMYQNLLSNIFGRGLGYFEMNDNEKTGFVEAFALSKNAPYAKNTLSSDFDYKSPDEIIDYLKRQAKANGKAIGVVKLTPALLNSLKAKLAEAQDEGYDIVPLSALADAGF